MLKCILALGTGVYSAIAFGADDDLPATQQRGQVTYLSGGIGLDQSQAIKNVMRDYPLTLTFVGTTRNENQYLADVPVTITDSNGNTILETSSAGHDMLARLPSGRYTIHATYEGKTEARTVDISTSQHSHQIFGWIM
jgi:hypothetical protein